MLIARLFAACVVLALYSRSASTSNSSRLIDQLESALAKPLRERIQKERSGWQSFLKNLPQANPRRGSRPRGIVIVGGGSHSKRLSGGFHTHNALFAIASIWNSGCHLPIELWHDGDPALSEPWIADAVRAALKDGGGELLLRNFREALPEEHKIKGYQFKTKAVLHSSFSQVLFMDADNVALRNPAELFDTSQFNATGAVFWPDFDVILPQNAMWYVVSRNPAPMFSFESGQMLINRDRHWRAVALADYFNSNGPAFYYGFLHGDKNMWLFAWLVTSSSFHRVQPLATAGYISTTGAFCGHTILQFQPVPPGTTTTRAAFAHRHLLKLSTSTRGRGLLWAAVKHRSLDFAYDATSRTPVIRQDFSTTHCDCRGGSDGGSGKVLFTQCMDLYRSPIDESAGGQALVARLAWVEAKMLRLREQVFHNSSSTALRPRWWLLLAAYLREQNAESSMW